MRTRNPLAYAAAASMAVLTLAAPSAASATSFDCSPPVQNGKTRSYRCVVDLPCSDAMKAAAGLLPVPQSGGNGDVGGWVFSSKTANSCHVSWSISKTAAGWIHCRTKFHPDDGETSCYDDWFEITQDLLAMHVVPGQGDGAVRTAMLAPSDHDLHLPVGGPVTVQLRGIDVETGGFTTYTGPVVARLVGGGALFGDESTHQIVFIEEGFASVNVMALPGGAPSMLTLASDDIEMAAIMVVPHDSAVTPARADADGDGQLTVFDAIHMLRRALDLEVPSGDWGDLDSNGQVNILDAALAVKALPYAPSGLVCGDDACDAGETSSSCPTDCEAPTMFPGCAPDPTLDPDFDHFSDAHAVDTDEDGQPDLWAADTNGDGLLDTAEVDLDGDGVVDGMELDLDGDGYPDVSEHDSDVCWLCVAQTALDLDGGVSCTPESEPLDPWTDLAAVIPGDADVLCVKPLFVKKVLGQIGAEPLGGGGYAVVVADGEGGWEQLVIDVVATPTPAECSMELAKEEVEEWVDPGEPFAQTDRMRNWINAECVLVQPGFERGCEPGANPWAGKGSFSTYERKDEKRCSAGTGSCTEYNVVLGTWRYYLDNQCALQVDDHSFKQWMCI